MTESTTQFFHSQSLTADDRFSTELVPQTNLVLKLSPDRLEVALIELKSNRCLQIEDFSLTDMRTEQLFFDNCAQFLAEHPLYSRKDWGRITWLVRGRKFSLVPQQVFDPENAAAFLEPIALFTPGYDHVRFYHHKNGMVNVFAVERPLLVLIDKVYGADKCHLVHAASAFSEGLVQSFSLTNTGKEMFVLVENRGLLVAVRQEGQILYCNAFSCHTESEAAYYVLLAMQETGMDQKKDPVNLYGQIDRASKPFNAVYPYVRFLFLGERPSFISFSNQFDKLAANRFYDLFAAHICS